jgi:hypothetical protein
MSSHRAPWRAPFVGIAAAALAGTMVACGGSPKSSASGPSSTNPTDQAVKFAQCMRQHGVNMPDPKPGAGGRFGLQVEVKGGAGKQKLDTASQACRKLLPNGGRPNLTPAQQAKFRDAALKFAQCMRAHGVQVPDPGQGGGIIQMRRSQNSAAFKSAMTACQSNLPFKPGAGPGAVAGGASK